MDMSSKERVLVVGAGAAGTAAAYSLSKHPDRFTVELWEKNAVSGTIYFYLISASVLNFFIVSPHTCISAIPLIQQYRM